MFVKEVEEALLNNRIDIAVHSLKDVPTKLPQGLSLAAVTARLDPRDVLVSRSGKLTELAPGSTIGTGGLRRAAQLLAYRPDLKVIGVRGNVDTRLEKVSCGELDGIIIAAAGVIRLGQESRITEYLPLESFLPAVGQGALGIEVRAEDKEMTELVHPVNHKPTWQSVVAERAFLNALGVGCRAPVAALGTMNGNTLTLQGMVATTDGSKILRATEEGDSLAPEQIGNRLAQRMVNMGALQLITEVGSR
jgi:hydroxymethylbilane synthase